LHDRGEESNAPAGPSPRSAPTGVPQGSSTRRGADIDRSGDAAADGPGTDRGTRSDADLVDPCRLWRVSDSPDAEGDGRSAIPGSHRGSAIMVRRCRRPAVPPATAVRPHLGQPSPTAWPPRRPQLSSAAGSSASPRGRCRRGRSRTGTAPSRRASRALRLRRRPLRRPRGAPRRSRPQPTPAARRRAARPPPRRHQSGAPPRQPARRRVTRPRPGRQPHPRRHRRRPPRRHRPPRPRPARRPSPRRSCRRSTRRAPSRACRLSPSPPAYRKARTPTIWRWRPRT
jgi:hypothetical protein